MLPKFLLSPESLIYAAKCDPSDPDDPAADICPLFQIVTVPLRGITCFLTPFSMIPQGNSVIPRRGPSSAGAYGVTTVPGLGRKLQARGDRAERTGAGYEALIPVNRR